ncbi:unnamed protein product [Enterobius vermicularis]|uniref:GRANULINS domain-containing protein n=1 Tax=Enterobius vermicularis TaxID=51028 RepID=A0A0N4V6Y6_ENTVE|nr:unnamed protein product [Enterobius vermicularis]
MSKKYGCCPLPNAVCCSDRMHCCPSGTRCDTSQSRCITVIHIEFFSCSRADGNFGCCPVRRGICCGNGTFCCPYQFRLTFLHITVF